MYTEVAVVILPKKTKKEQRKIQEVGSAVACLLASPTLSADESVARNRNIVPILVLMLLEKKCCIGIIFGINMFDIS